MAGVHGNEVTNALTVWGHGSQPPPPRGDTEQGHLLPPTPRRELGAGLSVTVEEMRPQHWARYSHRSYYGAPTSHTFSASISEAPSHVKRPDDKFHYNLAIQPFTRKQKGPGNYVAQRSTANIYF